MKRSAIRETRTTQDSATLHPNDAMNMDALRSSRKGNFRIKQLTEAACNDDGVWGTTGKSGRALLYHYFVRFAVDESE
jgi:hypothetical protein